MPNDDLIILAPMLLMWVVLLFVPMLFRLASLAPVFIDIGSQILNKLLRPKGQPQVETPRPNDPLWQVQHPPTEELRAIYREIDAEAMITDPDLLTPDGKVEKLQDAVAVAYGVEPELEAKRRQTQPISFAQMKEIIEQKERRDRQNGKKQA